jgi:hypothetical protein
MVGKRLIKVTEQNFDEEERVYSIIQKEAYALLNK